MQDEFGKEWVLLEEVVTRNREGRSRNWYLKMLKGWMNRDGAFKEEHTIQLNIRCDGWKFLEWRWRILLNPSTNGFVLAHTVDLDEFEDKNTLYGDMSQLKSDTFLISKPLALLLLCLNGKQLADWLSGYPAVLECDDFEIRCRMTCSDQSDDLTFMIPRKYQLLTLENTTHHRHTRVPPIWKRLCGTETDFKADEPPSGKRARTFDSLHE